MTEAVSRVGYLLVLAMLLSGLASAPQAQSRAATPRDRQQYSVAEAATTGEFTETLVADLTARRFQVSEGYPMLYPLDACINYTYPLLGTASETIPRLRM